MFKMIISSLFIKKIKFYLKTKSPKKSKIKYLFFEFLGNSLFVFSKIIPVLSNLSGKCRQVELMSIMENGDKYKNSVGQVVVLYDHYSINPDSLFDIKTNFVMIDIGAHIGVISVRNSRLIKEGKIFAIEPSHNSFNYLLDNIKINKINNITPINMGLSDKEEILNLHLSPNDACNTFLSFPDSTLSEKIKVDTLDNLSDKLKLKRIDVIKIDTEGFELKILKGSKKTIRKFKPKLIIETHLWSYSLKELYTQLKELKYNHFLEKESPLVETPIIFAEIKRKKK